MEVDLAVLSVGVERAVRDSATPTEAWADILAVVDATGYAVPKAIREYDIATLTVGLTEHFHSVVTIEIPPSRLTFYHLGLYDAGDPETKKETVGVYFAGGAGDPAQALLRGELTYRPNGGVLESAFLDAIRAAACDLGTARNVFEYGLLLGATAVLARFAIKPDDGTMRVTVGFDGGDYLIIH